MAILNFTCEITNYRLNFERKLRSHLSPIILVRLYYYMRNFYNLIGLERWYFRLIYNTYLSKLQTFCG